MYDDRIVTTRSRTAHISLTCVNHRDKRWDTKNISHIGARSIRYSGELQPDGSFKPGTYYGGDPLTMLRRSLNGKNMFNEDLPATEGAEIKTWENVVAFVESIQLESEKYSYECPCSLSDLEVAPEMLEGPEVDG